MRAEEQHAKSLLLRLKADGHHAAKPLGQSQVAESPDGLFFFQRGKRIIAQVAETQQPAEARHQIHQVVVQTFVLRSAAKIIAESHGNDGCRSLRIPVMQKERPGREPDHAEHAVQRLR